MLGQLAVLCQKNHTLRVETLEENKSFVERDGKTDSGSEQSDQDEDD